MYGYGYRVVEENGDVHATFDNANTSPYGFYEYKPAGHDDPDPNNERKYPLLIFFHGSDERGDGNNELSRLLAWGIPKQANAGTWHPNFIMLAPQAATSDDVHNWDSIKAFIEYAKQAYKVDESRIYLTGISMGGWSALCYLENYPTDHGTAAVVPISAVLETGWAESPNVAASGVPIWLLSNIEDGLIPWSDPSMYGNSVLSTRSSLNAINPGQVKLTGIDNSSHDGTWDGIYDSSLIGTANPDYDPFDESIYDWLMKHVKEAE